MRFGLVFCVDHVYCVKKKPYIIDATCLGNCRNAEGCIFKSWEQDRSAKNFTCHWLNRTFWRVESFASSYTRMRGANCPEQPKQINKMVENEILISLYKAIFCLFAIVLICLLITLYCLLFHPDEESSVGKHIREWNLNTGTFQAAHP